MKLQISFDLANLDQCIEIAEKVVQYADILEVGSSLVLKEGIKAVEIFKKQFPQKEIFADIKLVDRIDGTIKNYADAGASYVTILAGTSNAIIQEASQLAHSRNIKIALDLVDSYSIGQSAMDAKALDIDLIIFHGPYESSRVTEILEEWQSVRGNTNLPIYIAGGINKTNIDKILSFKPQGIIIGEAITKSDNPTKEAEFFKSLLK
ncbi:hypothetical protein GF322_01185 [Candidatus Dependentiae bacterium]|nr:hypothetical protein [Candidatus Dependentiae bacterium]